jgi:hypothetical protein
MARNHGYDLFYFLCLYFRSSTTAKIFSLSSLISVVKTLGAIHRSQNTNNQNKISMMTSDFQMRPTSNTSSKLDFPKSAVRGSDGLLSPASAPNSPVHFCSGDVSECSLLVSLSKWRFWQHGRRPEVKLTFFTNHCPWPSLLTLLMPFVLSKTSLA